MLQGNPRGCLRTKPCRLFPKEEIIALSKRGIEVRLARTGGEAPKSADRGGLAGEELVKGRVFDTVDEMPVVESGTPACLLIHVEANGMDDV